MTDLKSNKKTICDFVFILYKIFGAVQNLYLYICDTVKFF